MNSTSHSGAARQFRQRNDPALIWVILTLAIFAALLLGPVLGRRWLNEPPATAPPQAVPRSPNFKPIQSRSAPAFPTQVSAPRGEVVPEGLIAYAGPAQPEASGRQLVSRLIDLSSKAGPLTPAEVSALKQDLAGLVRNGPASVPAIREFLDLRLEFNLAVAPGAEPLAYPSLRASLINSLTQIGGPAAESALVQTLQTTTGPGEMLQLAEDLRELAPGRYSDQIASAVSATMGLSVPDLTGADTPSTTAAELAHSGSTSILDPLALANLPDGRGLPALLEMAGNSKPGAFGQAMATKMLAQLAAQNPQALDALVQLAQHRQIPDDVWAKVAPILAGNQYQFGSGSSSLTAAPTDPNLPSDYSVVNNANTPDQISQRMTLLETILNIMPPGSAATLAFSHELSILDTKLAPASTAGAER